MGHLTSELPRVDPVVMSQLRDVMEDEFADLLQTYLDGVPQELQRLNHALGAGQSQEVISCSHTLKGSSANLGILRLSRLFLELETLARGDTLDAAAHEIMRAIEIEFAAVRPLLEKALAE